MRTAVLLLAILQIASPPHTASRITVAQLEQFLASKRAAKESDADVAERLMRVEMAEELMPSALSRMGRGDRLGPATVEQLRILAAESIFEAPSPEQAIEAPAPDRATQDRILGQARSYAATALRHLPDFLAMRTSDSYDNLPQPAHANSTKRVVRMHFARQHRREVTYRNGVEVDEAQNRTTVSDGFSTTGEFGQLLHMVLVDSSKGTVAWSRWQKDASGARVAVFQYSVPVAASKYLVDVCCLPKSDGSAVFPYRGRPAYHGELFIHPGSGVVVRITVEAEASDGFPVQKCSMAVEYGEVKIDGRPYICPTRGVAVLVFSSPSMAKIDGIGLEKHIDEVRFDQYRKFGSTARMITAQ